MLKVSLLGSANWKSSDANSRILDYYDAALRKEIAQP